MLNKSVLQYGEIFNVQTKSYKLIQLTSQTVKQKGETIRYTSLNSIGSRKVLLHTLKAMNSSCAESIVVGNKTQSNQ